MSTLGKTTKTYSCVDIVIFKLPSHVHISNTLLHIWMRESMLVTSVTKDSTWLAHWRIIKYKFIQMKESLSVTNVTNPSKSPTIWRYTGRFTQKNMLLIVIFVIRASSNSTITRCILGKCILEPKPQEYRVNKTKSCCIIWKILYYAYEIYLQCPRFRMQHGFQSQSDSRVSVEGVDILNKVWIF